MVCLNPNRPLLDLHTHTDFSPDSQASMMSMCERALELGLQELAFCEHVDYVPADIGYNYFRPQLFFAEIERCRRLVGDRLTVLAGVEIGEVHRYRAQAKALVNAYPFDLVIGSLHWVGDEIPDFHGDYFRNRTLDDAYGRYFEQVEMMCRGGGFDVLGHMDLIKRYSPLPDYDLSRQRDRIRRILRVIIEQGIILEVNTSTLIQPVAEPSPGTMVLEWYREMGGDRVTVGSDAHSPERIGAGWLEAMHELQKAGPVALTSFRNRQPLELMVEYA